ncbi:GlxA family transcriptional regulator [Granulosicoccus antarcticus]|uniref:HTH-type transcriptional regulator CdhR n=1 Tax=Granulosicoccus antarcticus IMCC3135 TaxID=1192854 RepID=A0A2Z2NSI2_9GAMM|nr:helix-turn-helix domain-containing protein [Granulosicoccus antarcticus]ASJ72708.1 HTH-type transcriptional regulator CdhR [Granulosicoccus antarcticus IMCC3135]
MDNENELCEHQQTVNVTFVLQTHFSLLAFTAAADALTTANLVNRQKHFTFRTTSIQDKHVVSDLGIAIPVDETICDNTSSQPDNDVDIDVIIVCGGYRCDLVANPLLNEWLCQSEHRGCLLGGIWNGILQIALAGLMDGYSCSLHPDNHAHAARLHPNLQIRPDTVVVDRNRLSAAGPNSAFELMLLLIRRYDSAETVQEIRQILKADTSPSRLARTTAYPPGQDWLPQNLHSALVLMRSSLEEPVSKRHLAQHINLSIRAMERLFQRHLNTSPARHYLTLRLQRAHELLSHGDLSVGEISDACGFISSAHFSRSFNRRYGLAPSDVRRSVTALLDT